MSISDALAPVDVGRVGEVLKGDASGRGVSHLSPLAMLSTTTGTQINAGTYRLTIEAPQIEFKNLEVQ